MNSIIFIVFLIIVNFYLLNFLKKEKKNKKPVKENFIPMKLPSFKNFLKYSKGYTCDSKLDSIPIGLKKEYDLKTFCDQNPTMTTIEKLTTSLIKKKNVAVSKTKFRKFATKDLNVNVTFSGIINKTGINLDIKKKTEKNHKEKNLTKDEAIAECINDATCQYTAVGNLQGSKLGTSIMYYGAKADLKPNIKGNKNYDLYEKIYNIEYSIIFWLKIVKKNGSVRNIFHHGNKKNDLFPSIDIKPKSTGLIFKVATTAKIDGGEKLNIPGGSIPPNQWVHVGITVLGKKLAAYVAGKEVINTELAGFPEWPAKQKCFISSPFAGTGGYSLSIMRWYPFQLSKEFVQNLAMSTTPTKKVDKTTKALPNVDRTKILPQNGWKEDKRQDYKPLKATIKLGVVFIDGFLKCGNKAGLNQTCALLPEGTFPDRLIVTNVGTLGGNVLRLFIYPNGNMNLFDSKSRFGKGLNQRYQLGDSVIFSNIRYSLIKGSAIKLRNGVRNEPITGMPSFFSMGSIIFLNGGMSGVNGKWFSQLPTGKRPQNRGLYLSCDMDDVNGNEVFKPGRVDITKTGWCLASRSGNNVSLEGINFSTMKGEKLLLHSGYKNFNKEHWQEARVLLDNGVVKVSGLLAIYFRKFPKDKIKNIGCFKDKKSDRDLPYFVGIDMNKGSCAKAAFSKGHTYFALQNRGECRTGMNFGKYGKNSDCSLPCNNDKKTELGTCPDNYKYVGKGVCKGKSNCGTQSVNFKKENKAKWAKKCSAPYLNCKKLKVGETAPIGDESCYIAGPDYTPNNCGSKSSNNVFTIDSEWVKITRLPEKYRPKEHLSFLCVTDSVGNGKPGGTAVVNVNKDGWIHFLKKINSGSILLSLNNITFLQ